MAVGDRVERAGIDADPSLPSAMAVGHSPAIRCWRRSASAGLGIGPSRSDVLGAVLDHREHAVTRSSSSSRNRVTPIACRPVTRTWSAGTRISRPASVIEHHVVARAAPGRWRRRRVPFRADQRDVGDPLPAAAGHPVFVGRGALAEAAIGDGQQDFLGRLQLREPLRRAAAISATGSPRRRPSSGSASSSPLARRARPRLEIGRPLRRRWPPRGAAPTG